jgi:hypothetical protein
LIESADLRVYFIRIEGEGNTQKSCQLNSEMDTKETSEKKEKINEIFTSFHLTQNLIVDYNNSTRQ